ncbi:MAG: LuxR C-terminal-related transcriptional regulator [Actinomycetota bacterium]|nr:LuxR C-terminal-related transcriptional regulator [Actinomycetota bacterium]
MVRFIMTRPSGDQIAQHLVFKVLTAHAPRAAVISRVSGAGTLRAVGSFGLEGRSLDPYRRLSLWTSSPMSDAFRTGGPVILATADAVLHAYPDHLSANEPTETFAAWPLSLPVQRVGAVQISFARPPDPNALYTDVSAIAAILALYVSLMEAPDVDPQDRAAASGPVVRTDADGRPDAEHPGGRRNVPLVLTRRQLWIVELLADGLTNVQIAKRVKFSESTVRQETMVIYRYFGVSGREAAVWQARKRGMLGVTGDQTAMATPATNVRRDGGTGVIGSGI